MTNENQNTKKPLSPDDLNQFIVNARSSFRAYSQGVSSAAVNVYFLWRDTQASGATREGREWITGVITKRNEEIKKHNESVKAEKKYVDDYKKGKLSKDELVNQVGKNKEEKELIAAEKKRLDDLVKKDDKYWDAQKLVPIEKRFGASIFTEIVKYVFEFDKPSHASMINRFCLGLEWIHARFGKTVVTDVNEIIAEIDRAGGFEVAVEDQRLVNNSDHTLTEDREIIAKRNYEDTKGALKQAQSLGAVPLEARHDQEGLVIMIARYTGGNAEIVAELPAGEGEFKRLISRYENPTMLPVADTTEFISRLMEMGELVSEGEGSAEDGGKTQRLILTNMKDGRGELIISATNADSAAIVKVQPKDGIDVGIGQEQLYLRPSDRKILEQKVATYERRRLIDFTYDLQPKGKDGKSEVEAAMAC